MSEPVKSVEIEDVLSSIRRLVSEDHRQNTAAPEAEVKPAAAPERLVLTDALRVTEPEPAFEDDIHTSEGMPAPEAETPHEVSYGEQSIHEDDGDQADDHIQSWSEDEDSETEQPHSDADRTDDVAHDGETSDGGWHDEPSAEDAWEHTEHPAEEHRSGEEEEAQASDPQPDDEDAAPWVDPNATLYEAAGLSDGDSGDTAQPEDEDIRPLGDKIAALEEVIGRTEDQWEPDGASGDAYAGTEVETLEWEDSNPHPEESSPAPVMDAPPAFSVEEAPKSDAAEEDDAFADATLDEAALRELVADIVREELQGVLGERITRNVRKLVRREIHRALAVKNLD